MLGLECSTICSKDMDGQAEDQKPLKCGQEEERKRWVNEVTTETEEILRRVHEDRQLLNSIAKETSMDQPCFET